MSESGTLNLVRPAVKTRDDRYYYSLITIQVEDCLFRVPPSAFVEQSQVFRDMFSIPTNGEEGNSAKNPIYLAGVKLNVFRDLLELLYPRSRRKDTIEWVQELPWSADRRIKVLELAGMWDFKPVQDLAISELERCAIDVVHKIEIAHKHDIKHWYVPTYTDLAKREKPLETAEVIRLGCDFMAKIAQVRERRATRSTKNLRCNSCSYMEVHNQSPFSRFRSYRPPDPGAGENELIRKDIKEIFGIDCEHGWALSPNKLTMTICVIVSMISMDI
ncbi:hypothetical protein M0805_003198 [Coniferiporia weirii]|nr:hypothetical protein M0805_003198 [Coniferiporia weirii]